MILRTSSLHLHPQPYSGQVRAITTKVNDGDYDIVIPFITDIHHCPFRDLKWHGNIENRNIERMDAFIELTHALNPTVTVYGGDYATDWNTMEVITNAMKDLFKEMEKANGRKVYICGNHDFGDSYNIGKDSPNKPLSPSQFNQLMGGYGSDEMYFYLDIKEKKTRIICLNSSDSYILTPNGTQKYNRSEDEKCHVIRQEQVEWLVNKALNTPEEGWKIILMSHVPLRDNMHNGPEIADLLDSRNHNQDIVLSDTDSNPDFNLNIKAEFSKYKSCDIVCYISGHTHYDNLVDYHGINVVSTTFAKGDDLDHNLPTNLINTTFDVYCVSFKHRQVDVYRFGKGIDRKFKY